jgi:hypothetical protein
LPQYGGYGDCFGGSMGFTSPQSAPRKCISDSLCMTWLAPFGVVLVMSATVVITSPTVVT